MEFPLTMVRKLREKGNVKVHDEKVRLYIENWARRLLILAGVTTNVSGKEHIPEGPVVFVANHQGYFDIPLMITQLDQPHPIIAKKEIKKLPMIRSWMEELHCIFIDRKDPRQSMDCLKSAQKLLQEGYSVVIFPEGTRNKGGELLEFKSGGVRIAVKTKLPIVPVCIQGSHRVMEKNNMWIRPAKVSIQILPPIYTEALSKEDTRLLSEQLRGKMLETLAEM